MQKNCIFKALKLLNNLCIVMCGIKGLSFMSSRQRRKDGTFCASETCWVCRIELEWRITQNATLKYVKPLCVSKTLSKSSNLAVHFPKSFGDHVGAQLMAWLKRLGTSKRTQVLPTVWASYSFSLNKWIPESKFSFNYLDLWSRHGSFVY